MRTKLVGALLLAGIASGAGVVAASSADAGSPDRAALTSSTTATGVTGPSTGAQAAPPTLASVPGTPATAQALAAIQPIANTVLPGATVSLVSMAAANTVAPLAASAMASPGQVLVISQPGALPKPASGAIGSADGAVGTTDSSVGELGWKCDLLAAYVAGVQDGSIFGFEAEAPSADPSPEQANVLSGQFRGTVGGEVGDSSGDSLDLTPVAAATAQLQSNLKVLKETYGNSVPIATSVSTVPIDMANDAYALEATIEVPRLSDLQPHIGDITTGLKTGLVGDQSPLIEGLAIHMVDDSGQHADIFINARDSAGFGDTTAALDLDAGTTADATFPDLTNGPPTINITHG